MPASVPRTSWIVAPPEVCVLCLEPLGRPEASSAWNGRPAHKECVRVHMIQRDPAFREWGSEGGDGAGGEEPSEGPDPTITREDEDEDSG
ncbi:MAG: hypothetical protein L3K13_04690 [Thermoplasmata archaeon]|nr:hypothetical protein [Thermoplasmata archaeon]